MLRAVLFDLDDTLFDHENCARDALRAVHGAHASFGSVCFDDFERAHAQFLEELHRQVLAGNLDLDAARIERFRRLIESAGAKDYSPADAARTYRECYVQARREVTGARALLAALRPRFRIGIVSNNLLAEQQEKLRQCGLDVFVDALVVSEEAGVSKPDPAIFHEALSRLETAPEHTIMIGDSWPADVEGARAAGIAAIWFNRGGRPSPEPAAGVQELRSFEPVGDAIRRIISAYDSSHANRS